MKAFILLGLSALTLCAATASAQQKRNVLETQYQFCGEVSANSQELEECEQQALQAAQDKAYNDLCTAHKGSSWHLASSEAQSFTDNGDGSYTLTAYFQFEEVFGPNSGGRDVVCM